MSTQRTWWKYLYFFSKYLFHFLHKSLVYMRSRSQPHRIRHHQPISNAIYPLLPNLLIFHPTTSFPSSPNPSHAVPLSILRSCVFIKSASPLLSGSADKSDSHRRGVVRFQPGRLWWHHCRTNGGCAIKRRTRWIKTLWDCNPKVICLMEAWGVVAHGISHALFPKTCTCTLTWDFKRVF